MRPVLCVRVADVAPEQLRVPSEIRTCGRCGADVWADPVLLAELEADGIDAVPMCVAHAPELGPVAPTVRWSQVELAAAELGVSVDEILARAAAMGVEVEA